MIRSNDQAYCFVFTESWSKKTADRLKAFTNAKNGFELAEYDLQFRGAGDLYGVRQWGISDIAMDALKNVKMIEAARAESQKLLTEDANLSAYPTLKAHIKNLKKDLHFE
ncbi:MAG: hypothetical protein Q7R78_01095 [bacterium]|nr:hypothetical protein [bacterium]